MVLVLFALAAASACSVTSDKDPSSAVTPPAQSKDDLERAKLEAEIEGIQATTAEQTSTTEAWLRWAPFLTVLVAAGTLAAALLRQSSEGQANRRKEIEEKERERGRQQEATLSSTVQNLGSENARLRLNAAAALAPSLRLRESDASAQDLLAVLVANLRAEQDQHVLDVLVDDLEMALVRLCSVNQLPDHLDLSRARIRRLRLPPHLDLGLVDLAFGSCTDSLLDACTLVRLRGLQTDLSKTRFVGANLHEARLNQAICHGTNFRGARLVSATFKGACLIGAKFEEAQLQGAHLESARCFGAGFRNADVADAWFCNSRGDRATRLDKSALMSLRHAVNVERAHFSAPDRAWLDAHAG